MSEFLGGEGGGAYKAPGSGATTTVSISSTWADEMDDDYEAYPSDRVKQQVGVELRNCIQVLSKDFWPPSHPSLKKIA